jgi:ATP-binding cassette, subfamily A (ABC1), member 3
MADGQLRCAGSSLFLKKMYGVGYQLTIEKSRNEKGIMSPTNEPSDAIVKERKIYDVDEVFADDEESEMPLSDNFSSPLLNKIVKNAVPEAALLNDVGSEIRYQLPIGASSSFVAMFEQLDREVDSGSITSYGISITTLGMSYSIRSICRNFMCHNEQFRRSQLNFICF